MLYNINYFVRLEITKNLNNMEKEISSKYSHQIVSYIWKKADDTLLNTYYQIETILKKLTTKTLDR